LIKVQNAEQFMSKILKITDKLRELITAKKFSDGKLPPERELALQFGCCRKTIRTALANLEADGWIDRCRKKVQLSKNLYSAAKDLSG
jgi:DNA-binding GntR family transcriptional regulator